MHNSFVITVCSSSKAMRLQIETVCGVINIMGVAHMSEELLLSLHHTITPFFYKEGVYFTGWEWEWRKLS